MRKMPVHLPRNLDDGRLASGKSGANPYGLLVAGGNSVAHSTQVAGKGSLTFKPIKGLSISGIVSPFINYQKKKALKIHVDTPCPMIPKPLAVISTPGALGLPIRSQKLVTMIIMSLARQLPTIWEPLAVIISQ